MSLAKMNPFMGERIKTNCDNESASWAQVAHITYDSPDTELATPDSCMHAVSTSAVNVSADSLVMAASAPTDTLTLTSDILLGHVTNGLSIQLLTAANDTLAVTKDDVNGYIIISLAKTTATKNTAAKIQVAVRALATVAGVDVSNIAASAGGNWDTAAVATGEVGPVSFANGITTFDVYTTGITDPVIARNVTATAGGVGADIGAVVVTVNGTNLNDEVITEDLPTFVANTPAQKVGKLAFKTITSISIPAHDGLGATTKIGFGDCLGLPYTLSRNTVFKTYLGNTLEGTAPTLVIDDTDVEKNTIILNTTLNGSDVDMYLIID